MLLGVDGVGVGGGVGAAVQAVIRAREQRRRCKSSERGREMISPSFALPIQPLYYCTRAVLYYLGSAGHAGKWRAGRGRGGETIIPIDRQHSGGEPRDLE